MITDNQEREKRTKYLELTHKLKIVDRLIKETDETLISILYRFILIQRKKTTILNPDSPNNIANYKNLLFSNSFLINIQSEEVSIGSVEMELNEIIEKSEHMIYIMNDLKVLMQKEINRRAEFEK